MALSKLGRRSRIKKRIRGSLNGSAEKPRMSVYRSNKQIYVQLIDDRSGKTLVSASSKEKSVSEADARDKKEQARSVGKLIAEKAIDQGIKEVKFDRNGYLYHGRIKELADAARKRGLKF
jgi:large subunit ribosomal protein L18